MADPILRYQDGEPMPVIGVERPEPEEDDGLDIFPRLVARTRARAAEREARLARETQDVIPPPTAAALPPVDLDAPTESFGVLGRRKSRQK